MKNICVIGSGISGSTIANLLSKKYKVDVYEKVNFSKKHEIVFSSTKAIDLEALLNQIKLSYSEIDSLENLANFRLLTLPKDLSSIEPVSRRKNIFLSYF